MLAVDFYTVDSRDSLGDNPRLDGLRERIGLPRLAGALCYGRVEKPWESYPLSHAPLQTFQVVKKDHSDPDSYVTCSNHRVAYCNSDLKPVVIRRCAIKSLVASASPIAV